MLYYENYGPYVELLKTGSMVIDTKSLNKENWDLHFNSILNIMRDTIETDYCRTYFITVRFPEMDVQLSLIDYWFNLIMWYIFIAIDEEINVSHLFFDKCITRNSIKEYIDDKFIDKNRTKLSNLQLNNIIDNCMYNYSYIDIFSFYLANTINLEDFIKEMSVNPEFYNLLHSDLSNVPLDEVAHVGTEKMKRMIDIIEDSDHCLANFFRAKEGVNPKQFKEFGVNIGPKPDGKGGIYPVTVNTNYLIGGVNDQISNFIESSTGRTAQIIVEGNVGTSGHFARLLGLNNSDSILHEDPNYVCDTKNFQELIIKNKNMLERLIDRYYRLSPNGIEYKITKHDTHLIGQKIYLRSPMTCASLSRTGKICYRCYGDLAYTNRHINIGKMAAELLSSVLTQRMLSAKHLLEAVMKIIKWTKEFDQIFEVEYNLIKLKTDENKNFNGYKILIDPNNDEEDGGYDDEESKFRNSDYEFYVHDFDLVYPDGTIVNIHTSESDKIYLTSDLMEIIYNSGIERDNKIELSLNDLAKEDYLFAIQLLNNDLSKSLEKVKSIIDNSTMLKSLNRHEWLQALLEAIIECGLDITSVHTEIILSNQMRSTEDILLLPEWQYENEDCRLVTLKQSLNTHPSVCVALSFERLSKMLYDPLTFRKSKPSFMDLFYMEKPQNYLTKKVEIKKEKIKGEVEELFVKSR